MIFNTIRNYIKILLLQSIIIIMFINEKVNCSFGERETRAVWVATNHRLDWPPPVFDKETQKKSLESIFDDIKSKNLNTVFFQVRSNGTVLFKSSFDPFSPYINGKMEIDSSYDPLQFAIELAHKKGLEIHAWVNVVQIFSGRDVLIFNNMDHISKRKPEWIVEDNRDGSKSYWLDPGLPEVREYLSDLIEEMVQNYDIDGVHLDYIRYPGKNFDDDFSFNLYNEGLTRDNWRRKNISDLIGLINSKIKSVKPYVKLGAAPIGIYKNLQGMFGWEGYNEVYQDSREWLSKGLLDYVSPQIYWSFNSNARFDLLAKDWVKNSFGRNVILGIAAYKPEVKEEIEKMIHFSREINADGIAFFRYSNIKDYKFKNFSYRTYPASMSWLASIKTKAPYDLEYSFGDKGVINLSWKISNHNSLDSIRYFALYNLPHPAFELAQDYLFDVIPAEKTSLSMLINKPKKINYYFAMKSVSKLWDESSESSNVLQITIPELQRLSSMDRIDPKPILIKESSNNLKILIYSLVNETITIKGEIENQNENLLTAKLKKGKNIISIQADINKYNSLSIEYNSTGNSMKLRS